MLISKYEGVKKIARFILEPIIKILLDRKMKPKHKFLAYLFSGIFTTILGFILLVPHNFPSFLHPAVWILLIAFLLLYKALELYTKIYVGEWEY
jgi:uncharacterized membrane protein HdeD (DUF308 family)